MHLDFSRKGQLFKKTTTIKQSMRILQIALFQNNVFYNIDLNQRLPSHSAEAHKMFLKGPVRGAAKSHFHETDHHHLLHNTF